MKKMKKFLNMSLAVIMALSMAAPSFADVTNGDAGDTNVTTTTTTEQQAETGKIIIDNPIKLIPDEDGKLTVDNMYMAYKIFDVTYSVNGNDKYDAYTILSSSPWINVIADKNNTTGVYTVKQDIAGLTLTKGSGQVSVKINNVDTMVDVYRVTVTDDFSAAAFSNVLKAALSNADTDSALKASGQKITSSNQNGGIELSGLPLGYYFVTTNSGALCNLTTTDPTVTIHDKNDVPFEKADDKESVETGEVVNYIIAGKVPDTLGFTSYDYIITDTMSAGLTFNNDIVVYLATKVEDTWTANNGSKPEGLEEVKKDDGTIEYYQLDSTPLTATGEAADYVLSNPAANDDFTFQLKINVMNDNLKKNITRPIIVKYSATVNDDAVSVISTNNAKLEYSNNPVNSNDHGTLTDEETVYSAKVAIDKYAGNGTEGEDTSTKLAGAEFVLRKTENNQTLFYQYTPAKAATDTTSAEKAKVDWVTDQANATVMTTKTVTTTDVNGAETSIDGYAEFPGLKDGNYELVEIKAPDGYNLLTNAISVTINGTNATVDRSSLTVTSPVANATGTQLPSTGGIGTTIFYAVGIILMAGAAFFVVRRRRA